MSPPEAINDATIQEAIHAAVQVQDVIPVDHIEEGTEAAEAATEIQPNGQRRARHGNITKSTKLLNPKNSTTRTCHLLMRTKHRPSHFA